MTIDWQNVNSPLSSSSKVLPASSTVADACNIPFGVVYSPSVSSSAAPIQGGVLRCSSCKAYINKFSQISDSSWRCVFCKQDHEIPGNYKPDQEAANETYTSVLRGEGVVKNYVLFVVDDYLSTQDKLAIFSSMKQYISTAPDSTIISLFLLSSVVNVFMLGRTGATIQSEVFSGKMTQDVHKYLVFHAHELMCHLSNSRAHVLQMLDDLCEGLSCKSAALEGANNPFHTRRAAPRVKDKGAGKCLGFVFELILSLLNQDSKLEAVKHVFLFSGGELPAPNLPDTVQLEQRKQYFASLGLSLSKHKATTHLYCVGNAVFGIDVLETLINNCGGTIVIQKDLAEDISGDIHGCVSNIIGYDCVVRLQTTPNIILDKICGSPHDSSLFSTRFYLLTADQKLTALFGIPKRINVAPVFLQCTNSYTDVSTAVRVTHVTTVRYDCILDHEEIMCAMCPDAAFALCAREHLQCLDGRQENTNALLGQAHRLVTNSETSVNGKVKQMIDELLEKVYFMLHGPIISRMLQQRDLRHYITYILSRGSVGTVVHLVKPKLYAISITDTNALHVVEYPPLTLALRSNRLLLLDTYTDIQIWIGRQIKDSSEELLAQTKLFVQQITEERFPKPSLSVLHDTANTNRFVECYLMPLHRDNKTVQMTTLPELAELSESDYEDLLGKYEHIQSKTFNQWLDEIRLIVSSSIPF